MTVVADSTLIADAVATRLGNEVVDEGSGKQAVARALEIGKQIEDIHGVVVICDKVMGAIGNLELVRLN